MCVKPGSARFAVPLQRIIYNSAISTCENAEANTGHHRPTRSVVAEKTGGSRWAKRQTAQPVGPFESEN